MKKNIIFPILFFILGITILFFLSYSKDKNNNKTKENVQISSIQGNDNQIPSVTENILSIKLNNKVSLELVKVEAGSFTMSANDGENYENEVPHTATLTQDFYIGKYEVTQEQWEAVMGSNPSKFKGNKLPVESVSWHEAMDFCEKLNEQGKAPTGYHFTLPTETQWEHSAKGGKKSKGYKYSGSNTAGDVAWYDENSGSKTHEAGTKAPNELGLYDMSGNVLEWCLDDWTSYSSEAKAEFTRGKDSSSSGRVSRGGSWGSGARYCRAVNRRRNAPSFTLSHIGFRVALAPVEYRNAEETQAPSKQSAEIPSETAENETDEENIQVIKLNNKVSLELVKVEAGSFTMSANDGENYENEVPHTATLTQDYYIGKYEVTQEQWDSVMGSNPSYFKGDKLPVEQVSWYDAMDFCEKLNKSGKAPSGYHFTLPTETQWEYASKGGKKSKGYKYSGNDTLDEVGWYYENSGDKKLDDSKWDVEQLLKNNSKTHEVGMKAPNELGLYDMSGNVFEWCLDDYTDDSSKAKAEFTRGKDSSSSDRVYRGGSWFHNDWYCRAANRRDGAPSCTNYVLGFRVVLAPVEYRNVEAIQSSSKQSTEVPSETAENETDEENIQVIELNLNNKVSLDLVKVEAGSFTMSANDGENDSDEKSHTATLTQDFYIGKYKVTQEQWEAVMGGNPSYFKGNKLPVERVSWYDAMEFCKKLNKSGKAPSGYHFTLPTETQWEYAAKGGKKSMGYKYSGSNTVGEVAWYEGNSGSKTHEAGTKAPNELGLYDMSGNVFEWCLDDYTDDSSKAKAEFTRGKDSSSALRVSRGGGWHGYARRCRAASRFSFDPSSTRINLGFRVALATGQN